MDAAADQMDRYFETQTSKQPPESAVVESTPTSALEDAASMPLPGERITSVFGPRMHPIFRRRIFHEGVDFKATYKERVHCVLDGIVTRAGRCGGFGNAVYIYHPVAKMTSMYAHLCCITVRKGQQIKQQDIVGLAGSTGFSTGVHLHFGVKSDKNRWVDPLTFLDRVPDLQQIAVAKRGNSVTPNTVASATLPWRSSENLSVEPVKATRTAVDSARQSAPSDKAVAETLVNMLKALDRSALLGAVAREFDRTLVDDLVNVSIAETCLKRQFSIGG